MTEIIFQVGDIATCVDSAHSSTGIRIGDVLLVQLIKHSIGGQRVNGRIQNRYLVLDHSLYSKRFTKIKNEERL